jgi:uncharacterized membrane protein HdeD (DUF308 family)
MAKTYTQSTEEAHIHNPAEHGREMADRSGFMLAQGILLILLGVVVMIWPAASLVTLLFLLAVYGILSGIVEVIWGLFHIGRGATLPILIGIISLVIGFFIIRAPGLTLVTLFYLLGAWFIVMGFYSFSRTSSQAEAGAGSRTLSILSGILSIVVGILLFASPIISGVTLYWLLGIYAIIAGAILIGKSISARRHMAEDRRREEQRFRPAAQH